MKIKNDYSFPAACTIRFKFAAKGSRPALDLFWYDGSMRPPTPEELESGQQGIAGGRDDVRRRQGEDPRRFPRRGSAHHSREEDAGVPGGEEAAEEASEGGRDRPGAPPGGASWVAACKGGQPTYGDFLLAGPISDAFNLGAVSLRLGGAAAL